MCTPTLSPVKSPNGWKGLAWKWHCKASKSKRRIFIHKRPLYFGESLQSYIAKSRMTRDVYSTNQMTGICVCVCVVLYSLFDLH